MPDADHLVADLLRRLEDPTLVADTASASATALRVPGQWHPLSIGSGYPGIALAELVATHTDQRGAAHHRQVMRQHLAHSVTLTPPVASTSIMEGYGSLVTAAVAVAAATGDCLGFARTGLAWLAHLVEDVATRTLTGWDATSWHDERPWDALCGLAGAVRVLLAAEQHQIASHDAATDAGLAVLLRLCTLTDDQPAWLIPPEAQPRCPDGGADPGLAHGISGPLVTLAAAHRLGHRPADTPAAIRHVCGWLEHTQRDDHRWPFTVPADNQPAAATGRSAWCYGAGGIARALYVAGEALSDRGIQQRAVHTLTVVAGDIDGCRLSGPTICHGHAGMLHILTRTAHDSGDATLTKLADRYASIVSAAHDPGSPFGIRHLHTEAGGGQYAHIPGLLTGSAGVAAALATWQQPDVAPVWDLPLMVG